MGNKEVRSVYFLGIGGIGMSALARYFKWHGARVAGYDKTPTSLTDQLISEGMELHFEEDPSRIPEDVDLVIWTPAVPKEHAEYRYFSERGIPIRKRAEVLGEISSPFPTVAVAGTHGKTTTTTMIAHLFHTAGKPVMAFLGGISKNYETNFVQLAVGSSPFCIVEADEFDRSFLHLAPDIAIITSMDADHLDIYNHTDNLKQSFGEFAGRIRSNGSLILKKGIDLGSRIPEGISRFSYSLQGEADFCANNIAIHEGLIHFDFVTPVETMTGFVLGMPGMFNLENAIAALAVGWITGIQEKDLKRAIQRFTGVARRFDILINRDGLVYIDDYAHHPEELRACIRAVRELYPGKQVTGVFQPHLYSRTRDLADDFARVLAELDSLIILEIYPAREVPIEGISSGMLLKKTNLVDKQLCKKEDLLDILEERRPEVLLTLGAGDIDQLIKPIMERFGNK
ncbi:MAG: UDP-N-acetylmuramate--L-alanine ligase [Bacteroidales bacterium]|nr:UDP-N-acetylmuramate--L-alanine ligase [Bacteroidales bacterium]